MKKILFIIVSIWIVMVANAATQQDDHLVGVSGTVVDDSQTGEPMIGVSIAAYNSKGVKTKYVAVSDFDGNFKINAPAGYTLKFTYMGFETSSYKVKKQEEKVRIVMKEMTNELHETVVLGNRRMTKADVTSAVTVVKTDELAAAPVSNAMELLQGRVAGLNIQMDNGAPGSLGTITIRGVSDISVSSTSDGNDMLSSSTPLFVVDGIPQENVGEYDSQGLLAGSGVSPISSIPFEDIDNIQVLKDAAATSLYGSRGAYGVVIIETKKGSGGKPRISYSMDMKVNTPPKLRPVIVGATERWLRMNQILQNDTSIYHGYYEIAGNQVLTDSLNTYYNN